MICWIVTEKQSIQKTGGKKGMKSSVKEKTEGEDTGGEEKKGKGKRGHMMRQEETSTENMSELNSLKRKQNGEKTKRRLRIGKQTAR